MASGVLVNGELRDLLDPITNHPIPIFGPKDHGMEFVVGTGYNKPRKVDITLGVIHWTGSENPIETMFRVLNNRKLGVEFAISPLGSLYQFCDPCKVDTADAGKANKMSWGVEIVNQGIRQWYNPKKWKTPRAQKRSGFNLGPRPTYQTKIHGRKMRVWGFYPRQTATLCALNKLLADAIPSYGSGVCVEPGTMDFKGFNGAVGHFNVSRRKTDPGTQVMTDLQFFMQTGELPHDLAERLAA